MSYYGVSLWNLYTYIERMNKNRWWKKKWKKETTSKKPHEEEKNKFDLNVPA